MFWGEDFNSNSEFPVIAVVMEAIFIFSYQYSKPNKVKTTPVVCCAVGRAHVELYFYLSTPILCSLSRLCRMRSSFRLEEDGNANGRNGGEKKIEALNSRSEINLGERRARSNLHSGDLLTLFPACFVDSIHTVQHPIR